MLELKFYKSPWKATKLILLSLPFVLFSLYDIVSHNQTMPSALSWFCLCFFGLGIPLGLFNLFDRRPEIIVSEVGVFDRRTNKDFINWDVIEDAYIRDLHISRISSQKFLCLVLNPDAPILFKANKTLIRFSENLGFQGISIEYKSIKKK